MVDNQHKKIKGYRDLSEDEIAVMNEIKETEAYVANVLRATVEMDDVDKRWVAIARTHLEQGFMALVRSVAKPESPFN